MREKPSMAIERFRELDGPFASSAGEMWGRFVLPTGLMILSSGPASLDVGPNGLWEHVSVSCPGRCPTWDEMAAVKQAFWRDDETIVEFHPARSEYVNVHPYCLHLWKPPYRLELPPRGTMAP